MIGVRFNGFEDRSGDRLLRECWEASREICASASPCLMNCYGCRVWSLPADMSDLREGMVCPACRLPARMRAVRRMLERECSRDAAIYMTEQATPFYVQLQKDGYQVQGSEFAPSFLHRRRLTRHLRSMGGHGVVVFQDVTKLSWRDGVFDAVLRKV